MGSLKMWGRSIAVALSLMATAVCAGTLEDIKAKGVLVVGTKADYAPFGFRDSQGNVVGIEPDLAAELAKRLQVTLKIVPVLSSERITALQTGKVDLIIATMSVTDERKKLAGFIDPPYYASGAGILYRSSLRVDEIRDLAGKTVCTVDGNIFLQDLRTSYPQIKTESYKDLPSAEAALFNQQCDALFFDDVPLLYKKTSQADRYKDFKFEPLIEIDPLLWGIGVKLGEEKTPWGKFVSNTVIDWHRSSFLLQTEKKWLGDNTALLKALKEKWSMSAAGSR